MQIELQDFARAARAAARAASAKTGSSRCSACKARGVTLWKVAGHLVWPAAAPPTKWPTRANQDIDKSRTAGKLPEKREL